MVPWINDGKLPTFATIMQRGSYGPLRSTTPYYSAPAWVSMVTGVQPGKHGIYDFFRTDTPKKSIVTSQYRKAPALWKILTEYDKSSIIVNVPGTFPPEKINGVMITGLLTPSKDSNYTYPSSLKKELVPERLGEYELEQVAVDDIPKNLIARYSPEKLAEMVNHNTTSHATVTMNLMAREEWDFSMVVFRGTDDVQHLLWHRKDLILTCYQKADEFIGKMMRSYPDAMFIIVSDHGFGQPKKYFYVNNALYNAGYLHAKSDPSRNIFTLINLLFDTFSNLIFHVVPIQQIARSDIGRKIILSSGSGSNIDFSKTRAMYHSVCSRGIRINLKGKYPHGIVEERDYESLRKEIIDFLRGIKDPETNEHLVKTIYTKEEVYGDHAVNDPLDIIFDLEEDYGAQELLQPLGGLHGLFSSQRKLEIVTQPGFFDWEGDHRPNGIFFSYGPNIKNTTVEASIVDIVPTILASMHLSIPKNLDGNVLNDIFIEPPPVTMSDSTPEKKQLLSMAELQKIKKLRHHSKKNKD